MEKLIGRFQFTAYEGEIRKDKDGQILNKKVYASPVKENLIVTVGKNLVLDRLFAIFTAPAVAVPGAITSVGVGDSATAAAAGQTGLQGTTNVLIQTADAGTSRTNQTVTITSTFGTAVANFTWNEIGLFNGNTNNTSIMFDRILIGPFSKTSAVSIVASVQISQA